MSRPPVHELPLRMGRSPGIGVRTFTRRPLDNGAVIYSVYRQSPVFTMPMASSLVFLTVAPGDTRPRTARRLAEARKVAIDSVRIQLSAFL